MAYPNINNIILPTCCQDRITEINRKLKLGNYLQPILAAGTLFNIIGPSPHTINTIVSVHQTDFVTFAQSMQAVPAIPRRVAMNECQYERINHIGNSKLEKFWGALADAFL